MCVGDGPAGRLSVSYVNVVLTSKRLDQRDSPLTSRPRQREQNRETDPIQKKTSAGGGGGRECDQAIVGWHESTRPRTYSPALRVG